MQEGGASDETLMLEAGDIGTRAAGADAFETGIVPGGTPIMITDFTAAADQLPIFYYDTDDYPVTLTIDDNGSSGVTDMLFKGIVTVQMASNIAYLGSPWMPS